MISLYDIIILWQTAPDVVYYLYEMSIFFDGCAGKNSGGLGMEQLFFVYVADLEGELFSKFESLDDR